MKLLIIAFLLPLFSLDGQSTFDKEIAKAARDMVCKVPDERNPVTLNARLVKEGDSVAVIVKATIAPGWHIYAYVPPDLPYIRIDPILQLPGHMKAVGKWVNTEPEASSADKGVLMYESEAVFIHKAVTTQNVSAALIKAGLYYQTCNVRQCLPPVEKTFDLKY